MMSRSMKLIRKLPACTRYYTIKMGYINENAERKLILEHNKH